MSRNVISTWAVFSFRDTRFQFINFDEKYFDDILEILFSFIEYLTIPFKMKYKFMIKQISVPFWIVGDERIAENNLMSWQVAERIMKFFQQYTMYHESAFIKLPFTWMYFYKITLKWKLFFIDSHWNVFNSTFCYNWSRRPFWKLKVHAVTLKCCDIGFILSENYFKLDRNILAIVEVQFLLTGKNPDCWLPNRMEAT